ncbi:MAG: RHS repeat-associated core domain-containing protein, partial [Terriglobia bacterium]
PLFNIPQTYDYDPTGNPLVTPTQGPLTDFRYAGMFYHADSGLYLTEHRAYDPRTGRWLTRDPLGEGSDPAANLYRYVQGNPISFVDPFGLDAGGVYSYVPPGGYWSPGEPFPPPPGGSGSPCPPGDAAGGPPPTIFRGAADAAPPSPDGGDFEPVGGPDIGPGYPGYDGPTILLAGYFTSNIDSSAARALGMSRNQLGDAVHAIKGALGLGGADNVLLHVPSGDVYYNDEVIGNVRDE